VYDTITEKSPRQNAGAFSSGAKSWLFGCGMPHIRLFNCLFIITPVFSNGHTQKKKAHVSMRLFLVNRCSGECTPRQKPGVAPDFLIVPPISEMVTLAEKKISCSLFFFSGICYNDRKRGKNYSTERRHDRECPIVSTLENHGQTRKQNFPAKAKP
jgi:hypothetical protein